MFKNMKNIYNLCEKYEKLVGNNAFLIMKQTFSTSHILKGYMNKCSQTQVKSVIKVYHMLKCIKDLLYLFFHRNLIVAFDSACGTHEGFNINDASN